LDEVEIKKLIDWQTEHDTVCPYYDDGTGPVSKSGAIGGRTMYSFTPTSIGTIASVKCCCDRGSACDLTNYGVW